MKLKSFYLLMIALAAVLMSCSKNEDTVDVAKLVGKWTLETEVLYVKQAGLPYGYTYQGTADDTINLLADGTFTWSVDGDDMTGTYTISSKQVTLKFNETSITTTLTVNTLTNNQLVLYYKKSTDTNNYTEETLTFKR